MKNLLCVFCVLCGSVLSFALDRHAFTFIDYDLTITLDPPTSGFTAQGSATLRNDTSEPQKIAVLQVSSSLDWKTISLAGKLVQYVTQEYTSDLDHTGALSEAIVTLPSPIPPKGTVVLHFGYAGKITADATRLRRVGVPEKTALASDWDRIDTSAYSAVRGVGHVAWYPIATEAVSLSDGTAVFQEIAAWNQRERECNLKAWFYSPTPALFFADGTRLSTDYFTAPTGREKILAAYDWRPLLGRTPSFALGTYQKLLPSPIEIDYLPGHQPLAEDYARITTLLRPLVAQWFGEPSHAINIVELAWPEASSWESGTMFLTPLKQSLAEPLQIQLVHQLTHAALYSPRPWIYEGTAEFAQALERERQSGRQAAIEFMQDQSAPLKAAQQPNLPNAPGQHDTTPARRLEPLATTSDEVFYRIKAMRVWWMLRELVGDAALQRALHTYKAQDDREPSYMQRLLEAETLRKLEWFFDDWVYRDRGLPDFRIDSVYPRATLAGGYTLTVTVENRGDAGAEVPVTVETAHGQVMRRLEVHGRQKAVIRIEVPETPKRVGVNDGSVPELERASHSFEVKIPSTQ